MALKLDDLKTKPTEIKVNLQITGPSGASRANRDVTVDSRVVTPTSDVTYSEPIGLFTDAVEPATVTIGGLQGTTQKIEVSKGGTANCYWLPWGTGRVYHGELGIDHEYFFTYTINGCGLMIAGPPNAPQVAHANLESDRLLAPVLKANAKLGLKPTREARDLAAKEVAKKQAITYEQFYGNLAALLLDDELLGGRRIEVVTPDQYLIRAGAGFGAVFGVKGLGNAWTFYGNWAGGTRQIWP